VDKELRRGEGAQLGGNSVSKETWRKGGDRVSRPQGADEAVVKESKSMRRMILKPRETISFHKNKYWENGDLGRALKEGIVD